MKSEGNLALRTIFCLALGVATFLSSMPVAAEKETISRPKIFSGFGSYSRRFAKLCEELEKDGRRGKFRDVVAANDVKDLDCIACKPFFNSMKMMCTDKQPRGRKTADTTPKVPPQREPHINVLLVATEIVQELASDEKKKEELTLAVTKFAKGLRENTTLSPGEKDYFEVLASLFEGPFRQEAAKTSSNNGGAPHQFPQISADDLFED